MAEALGDVVPMPALPVDGKVFVCAFKLFVKNRIITVEKNLYIVFMLEFLERKCV